MLGLLLFPKLVILSVLGFAGLMMTALPGIILFATWRTVGRVLKMVLFIVLGVGALIMLILFFVLFVLLFGIALL